MILLFIGAITAGAGLGVGDAAFTLLGPALAATGLRVLTDDEFFAQVSLSHIYKLNCYMGTLQVLSSFEADKSARE